MRGRPQLYKRLVYLTDTVQAELLLYFYPERLTDDAAAAAQVKAHAESRTGDMLDLIAAALAAGPGPFLLGAAYRAVASGARARSGHGATGTVAG